MEKVIFRGGDKAKCEWRCRKSEKKRRENGKGIEQRSETGQNPARETGQRCV